MDPKPGDKELLKPEELGGQKARRRRPMGVDDFPFPFRWWMGGEFIEPRRGVKHYGIYVRALTRDQRCGLIDAISSSLLSPEPGVMREEDFRIWAGYDAAEWTVVRDSFMRLFQVRKNGLWEMPIIRSVFLAQRERLRLARAASKAALRKRWPEKEKQRLARARRAAENAVRIADRKADRIASLLNSQNQNLIPPPPVPHDPGLLPDAAAVAGLVGLVGARLARGGSNP